MTLQTHQIDMQFLKDAKSRTSASYSSEKLTNLIGGVVTPSYNTSFGGLSNERLRDQVHA